MNASTAFSILTIFLKPNTKDTVQNTEVYNLILAELIEFSGYKYLDRDALILYNIKELLK